MSEVQRSAKVSECRRYRYALTRTWKPREPEALFVMLNPSIADGLRDDPTIRKCIGFAQRWALGGIRVVNLFAYRATDPRELRLAQKRGEDVEGPLNTEHLLAHAIDANRVIVAWGAHANFYPQAVRSTLAALGRKPLWSLGVTDGGQPRHPLMLPYSTALQPFSLPERKTP
jgi:hypothetical protein